MSRLACGRVGVRFRIKLYREGIIFSDDLYWKHVAREIENMNGCIDSKIVVKIGGMEGEHSVSKIVSDARHLHVL